MRNERSARLSQVARIGRTEARLDGNESQDPDDVPIEKLRAVLKAMKARLDQHENRLDQQQGVLQAHEARLDALDGGGG